MLCWDEGLTRGGKNNSFIYQTRAARQRVVSCLITVMAVQCSLSTAGCALPRLQWRLPERSMYIEWSVDAAE